MKNNFFFNKSSCILPSLSTLIICLVTVFFATSCITKPTETQSLAKEQQEQAKQGMSQEIEALLIGKTWLLSKITINNEEHALDPSHGADIRLLFRKGNEISGSTGSNLFMGTWVQKKEKGSLIPVQISPLGMTMMAPINETASLFEQNLIRTFEQVAFLEIKENVLVFSDSSKRVILEYIFLGNSSF